MITKSMKTEVPKQIFEDELFDKFCEDEIVNKKNIMKIYLKKILINQ
jgi:hypothetical protein